MAKQRCSLSTLVIYGDEELNLMEMRAAKPTDIRKKSKSGELTSTFPSILLLFFVPMYSFDHVDNTEAAQPFII